MEVLLAKSAGFCYGVEMAIDKVYKTINENHNKKIYTYGPIIHNDTVLGDLSDQGVSIINNEEELYAIDEGIIIIRAHGVSKNIYNILKDKGIEWIDGTCPYVKRIHKIVEQRSEKGEQIVIVGNPNHPEVIGIEGWSSTKPWIVETEQDIIKCKQNSDKKLCIVAQTTFNSNKFQYLVDIFVKRGYYINVANTICNATHERQDEAADIADRVDAMIVIGGNQSSNTRKLYDICKERCANTYCISTYEDLHLELPSSAQKVGITAGASTPKKIIEEVQNNVRKNF